MRTEGIYHEDADRRDPSVGISEERCGFHSPPWASRCSSRARTSPTSSWFARRRATGGRPPPGPWRRPSRHRALFPGPRACCSRCRRHVGSLRRGAVRSPVTLGPTNIPRLEEVRLDTVVAAFTLGLSLVTAVGFGSIPLLRFAPAPRSGARGGGRGNTASPRRNRARHLLMGGQIALALVLLISSGLMLRSFQKLRALDPGFDATAALTFRVGLPRSEYPEQGRMVAAHRRDPRFGFRHCRASLPSPRRPCLPFSEGCNQGGPLFVEGRVLPPGTNPPLVGFYAVAGRLL